MATPIPASRPRFGRGDAGAKNPASLVPDTSRLTAAPRRHARPYLLLGAVLTAAGAIVCAWAFTHLGGRTAVLQLAEPVTVGQTISLADLRSVQVAADSSVPLIPTSAASSVVGHRAGVALPAGTLLSQADLASGAVPAAGQTVVSLELKPGAYPTQLGAGERVAVAAVTPAGQASVPLVVADLPTASVLSTTAAPSGSGDLEVSLLAGQGAAGQIAAIPADDAQLIVIASSGGA